MKYLGLLLVVLCPLFASADIQDRINDCEAKGGGKCLYSLLRELAKTSSTTVSENKCKCKTEERQVGSTCGLGEYLFVMTRDGRSIGTSPCFKNPDNAYAECIRKSNTESACR